MAMAIDPSNFLLDFSSTTTASIENDSTWNNWTPLVDWETLSFQHNEFNQLIESMMETDDAFYAPLFLHNDQDNSISTPETTTTSATNHDDHDNQIIDIEDDEECVESEDSKGLRLIHLLMAAAEALGGSNKSRELCRVILLRLKQLVSPTQGSNMERLAAHFTQALQTLLEPTTGPHSHQREDHSDILPAFQLLQDMSPYVKFGHFTANQAILESVTHHRRIHIVDYDIMEGIQWASLMQSLVSRNETTPHLRITALTRAASTGRRTLSTVQETGRRLTAFAASIGLPFSFHQCRLDSDESFRSNSLKLVRGEALVFNCVLHMPHFSFRANESVSSFLSGAKLLNPILITLVEEEVGPIGYGFIERFMDTLHHYSAIYDSLEAGFPMQSRARALVERVFLGPRIIGSVGRIYRTRADKECGSWGNWLRNVGFNGVDVSFANHCQAKLLLGLYNDGYKVEEVGGNRLILGWKSRRILSASVWTSPNDNENTIN